ncbi:hypothetical protein [Methylopila sp. 73B]|uniref:hypothetical protein n=1 Tax=Methylopila sp. 73B TaxID=1120792 RepID=UPI0003A9A977|nr:hypothetical protein [Methylopila sp. 73B]
MSHAVEDLRATLDRAQSRLAYVRYVGANTTIEQEAHDLNAEAARLVKEIARLRKEIESASVDPEGSNARGCG